MNLHDSSIESELTRCLHHKSTCTTQSILGPHVMQIWSRYGRNFDATKTPNSTECNHTRVQEVVGRFSSASAGALDVWKLLPRRQNRLLAAPSKNMAGNLWRSVQPSLPGTLMSTLHLPIYLGEIYGLFRLTCPYISVKYMGG